jgi:hypothetical protein
MEDLVHSLETMRPESSVVTPTFQEPTQDLSKLMISEKKSQSPERLIKVKKEEGKS